MLFDALAIEWQYEPEGFELPCGRYLPDFWLPQVRHYAEVKPRPFDPTELTKATQLAALVGFPVLLLEGQPAQRLYATISGAEWDKTVGQWRVRGEVVDIGDSNHYWITEGRFYHDGCWDEPLGGTNPHHMEALFPPPLDVFLLEREWLDKHPITSALSARFEFLGRRTHP